MSHPTSEDEANGDSASTTYNIEGFPVTETIPTGPCYRLRNPDNTGPGDDVQRYPSEHEAHRALGFISDCLQLSCHQRGILEYTGNGESMLKGGQR